MSGSYDRDHARRLMSRHLEQDLSDSEWAELEAILETSDEARRDLLLLSSLHQELFVQAQVARPAARKAAPRRRPWIPIAAAAAIFVALALSVALLNPQPAENVELPEAPLVERPEPVRPTPQAARRQAEEVLEEIVRQQGQLEESRKTADQADQQRERREAEARLALNAAERQAAVENLEEARAEERKIEEKTPKEAPAPATVVFLATVTRAEGEVFVTSGGARSAARIGLGLQSGDGLEVIQGASALLFGDGTRLSLAPQTSIASITDAAGKRVALDRGRVSAEVAKQPAGRPLVFATPHGEARVLGTTLLLRVTPDATELEVKTGSVRLTRAKDKAGVDVAGGHLAEIAPGAEFGARAVRVLEFQDGARYAGTRSTFLSQDEATKNFAAADVLLSDGDYPEGTHRDREILLKWDLSEIPPGLKVRDAAIVVHVADGSAHPYPITAMKRDWTETEATWRESARNKPWQSGGGQGATERSTTVMGSVVSTDAGFAATPLNAEGLAVVQSWIDDPRNNHGVMICNPNTSDAMGITSRRAPDPLRRPKLVVTVVSKARR
jgi:ferric-dicitrate binding protein FerR (iron transport regulator)